VATRPVTVVIADRYPVVLSGLISFLQAESDFKVVASCRDGTACMQAILDLSPDLALLEMSLPGMNALRLLAAIKSELSRTRVIFLSASLQGPAREAAIVAGAYGVIPKDATGELLVRCLRQVASGQKLPPVTSCNPESRSGQHSSRGAAETLMTTLTEREREIVCLVSEGLSNKEIARRLNLCDDTIKMHLHHIYQKLAIRNRMALAVSAGRDPAAAE
jgi:two-component system, NarL family, nitrate/nitrite response regulator NarL